MGGPAAGVITDPTVMTDPQIKASRVTPEFHQSERARHEATTALAVVQQTEALTEQRQTLDIEAQDERNHQLEKFRIYHQTIRMCATLGAGTLLFLTWLLAL